jgi:hypothetical protein
VADYCTETAPDEMNVTVMPAVVPLVAHADVTGYVGLTGLSAVAAGGNTDTTHPVTYSSKDTSKVEVNATTGALTLKAVTIKATGAAHGVYPEQTVTTKVADQDRLCPSKQGKSRNSRHMSPETAL